MVTTKLKFKPSQDAQAPGTIYVQIIYKRCVRQFSTDCKLFPEEWDACKSRVIINSKNTRRNYLYQIRHTLESILTRIGRIISRLEDRGYEYDVNEIVEEYRLYSDEYSVFNYMETLISNLKKKGSIRTSETYKTTLNSFKRFRNEEDIMLDCLTSEIIEEYEAWQKSRGITPNTSSFYMRILRATYNRAVEEGIIENKFPFRRVYAGVDKTVKRALSIEIIKKIKDIKLKSLSPIDFARDMFLMSFYLRGMSFIDMAFLKKTDLVNGLIIYRRRKTGQELSIRWTDEMQQILNKYPVMESEYLLPIIKNNRIDPWYAYRNVGYNVNHNLKWLAKMLGLLTPLTMYVARHSWASIAKGKGVALSVISEGMGHNSEKTTQIYLASLNNNAVDDANSLIIKSI